jgi:hypothetical protein
MNDYLPNATNFIDIGIQAKYPGHGRQKKCPLCKGHGRWNLELNAYGKGVHFQQMCSQCRGFGYVESGSLDATCIHEWKEIGHKEANELGVRTWGMCCHVYLCGKCKKTSVEDSSD